MFILLFALAFPAAAFSQDGEGELDLFRLEIRNRIESTVTVVLSKPGSAYVLTAQPDSERVFTIREGAYDQTTFACGETSQGTLVVFQQVRLVFTTCPGAAPNSGVPSIEKVNLRDAPEGKKWFYQYKLLPPVPPVFNGSATGPYQFTASGDIMIYRLPDTASVGFAMEGAGFSTILDSQTAEGCL